MLLIKKERIEGFLDIRETDNKKLACRIVYKGKPFPRQKGQYLKEDYFCEETKKRLKEQWEKEQNTRKDI